jgi:hypothetical protein
MNPKNSQGDSRRLSMGDPVFSFLDWRFFSALIAAPFSVSRELNFSFITL